MKQRTAETLLRDLLRADSRTLTFHLPIFPFHFLSSLALGLSRSFLVPGLEWLLPDLQRAGANERIVGQCQSTTLSSPLPSYNHTLLFITIAHSSIYSYRLTEVSVCKTIESVCRSQKSTTPNRRQRFAVQHGSHRGHWPIFGPMLHRGSPVVSTSRARDSCLMSTPIALPPRVMRSRGRANFWSVNYATARDESGVRRDCGAKRTRGLSSIRDLKKTKFSKNIGQSSPFCPALACIYIANCTLKFLRTSNFRRARHNHG